MALQTPLHDRHVALGARMVDFAGWDMPVQYSAGILKEHETTRQAASIFDTSHMGEYLFEGEDVRGALNGLLAGDFSGIKDGRLRYSFLCHDDGSVIDDAVVKFFSPTKAWLVVNAGDIPGKFAWIQEHMPASISVTDLSKQTGKLDIQGPMAHEVTSTVLGTDFRSMPFWSFIEMEWNGAPLLFSRSGYSGEPGVELYIGADKVGELWDALLAAGTGVGLAPAGLGARDTLRLEAGLPLYGHELSRESGRNPIQAGLTTFVSLEKPQDFPGKSALAGIAAEAAALPRLVGLTMDGKRSPREGFAIVHDGAEVGVVTSGAPCPTVGVPCAFAYLAPSAAEVGTPVSVMIRGKELPATVVELPFYRNPDLRARV